MARPRKGDGRALVQCHSMLSTEKLTERPPAGAAADQAKPPRTGPYIAGSLTEYCAHAAVRVTFELTLNVSALAAPMIPPATNVTTSPPTPPFAHTVTCVAPAWMESPGEAPQLPCGYCQYTPPQAMPPTMGA